MGCVGFFTDDRWFFGYGWFFGFGWFFTDPGGFSDLDNPKLIFVVLRIWMGYIY
jgi:hypothetical protein